MIFTSTSQFGKVVIAGDFNASCKKSDYNKTNRYKSNELIEFILNNDVVPINLSTHSKGPTYRNPTRIHYVRFCNCSSGSV